MKIVFVFVAWNWGLDVGIEAPSFNSKVWLHCIPIEFEFEFDWKSEILEIWTMLLCMNFFWIAHWTFFGIHI